MRLFIIVVSFSNGTLLPEAYGRAEASLHQCKKKDIRRKLVSL